MECKLCGVIFEPDSEVESRAGAVIPNWAGSNGFCRPAHYVGWMTKFKQWGSHPGGEL